jgi:arylsulfatase A-like enzyme
VRAFLWRRIGPASLLALAACGGSGASGPSPTGVLLISVDSLRSDHLSCYDYKSATRPDILTSPSIDALAAEGVLFEQAVSTTSWTVPAHKSLLTGLPDELHGGTTLGPLPESRHLISEAFQKAGWRTAGFFSGPNLHPWYGFGRGFERYVDCSNAPVDDGAQVFELENQDERNAMHDVQRASHQGVTGPKLVAAFDEWFDGLGKDERFFAFVHMWDVHYDYAAPPEDDVFFPEYDGWLDGSNYGELTKKTERDPRDIARLIALYDAEVRFTDRHVALLLDRLRKAGRLDDTLVVLVSDHGEEFFEHGHYGHNRTLFEEVVRVPLILRYPRALPRGARLRDLASLADVAPTILALCRLPRPRGPCAMWGRSLLPALDGELDERDAPLDLRLLREDNPLRGMRGPAHKFVQDAGTLDVFDLARDPRELEPTRLDDTQQGRDPRFERAAKLWSELATCSEALGIGESFADMPEDLQRRLRDLGYTGESKDQ